VSDTIIISVTLSDSVTVTLSDSVTVTECDTVLQNNDTLSVAHHYHQCHTQWQCHSHSVWHKCQWTMTHSVSDTIIISVTLSDSVTVTQCDTVSARQSETQSTPLTPCDSVSECQQCSKKGKWQRLLQMTVKHWKTKHQRAAAVQHTHHSHIKTSALCSWQTIS